MRTACYARFSSDLQRQTSLEDQIRGCREMAERHGWTWQDEHIYTDAAISGASIDGRPGLQALLAAAAGPTRPFDVLLVDDSSRVARDLADALRVLQRLRFAGVRVIYISQNIDSASEQAETLVAVHGLVDGLYLREMAQKIRRGLVGQLERGFSTGNRTYGYRTVPVPDPSGRLDPDGRPVLLGRRLEINDAEANLVRRIFTEYASGSGVPSIVDRLNREKVTAPLRLPRWGSGAIRRMLKNERYRGLQIWGQRRYERRPGTRQQVAKWLPRAEWRIIEHPELRIVSEELWNAVAARRAEIDVGIQRQPARNLMRGKNAAQHSRHLFAGFMRCGTCGGAITIVTGGHGSPRYGCQRHKNNLDSACTNRLTIRAKVADAVLLAGLQAELLRPGTIAYVSEALTKALNDIIDRRPQQRAELARAREAAQSKLVNLIAAIEGGTPPHAIIGAIGARETEITELTAQLSALDEPIEDRMAVIPTWVRRQLEDAAGLLSQVPDRAKAEFRRLGIGFTLHPVRGEGTRPFLRAVGSGDFEHLAFSQHTAFTLRGSSHLPRAR